MVDHFPGTIFRTKAEHELTEVTTPLPRPKNRFAPLSNSFYAKSRGVGKGLLYER